MLRFVPPAGTPLRIADVLRGASAAAWSNNDFEPSFSCVGEGLRAHSAVATCSGRAALWLVLKALHRLRPDRNVVILPAYTCFTVPAAVVRAGLEPCPVDMDPTTLDFDFHELESVSPSGLLCILTSNLCGFPNDAERVCKIALAKDAFVVDDAAQALGAASNGRWAGMRGDAGIFSFGRGKALAAVEGGLAVASSEAVGAALELEAAGLPEPSSSHSVALLFQMLAYAAFLNPRLYWIPNSIPYLGLGSTEFSPDFPVSRMSSVATGLLARIIGKLGEINAGRVRNAASMSTGLAGHPQLTIPTPLSGSKPVYTRLPVIASDASTRDRAVAQLRAAGIGASPFYPAALCDIQELERHVARGFRHCPAAESLAERLFTLPTHAHVSESDINRTIKILSGVDTPRERLSRRGLFQRAANDQSQGMSHRPAPNPESRILNPERRTASRLCLTPDRQPGSKRLLLIAFDFPPRRTSGIYRPTGLAKYLARLGWHTTVLTVEADGRDLQDQALLERVPPQTEIVRTRYFNFMAWEDSTAGAVRNLGALKTEAAVTYSSMVDKFLRRTAGWIRSCAYFPDDTAGWVPFGLTKAVQLLKREHFDVVYTTSPPRSSLVIGLFLKFLFSTPWIAEFRDPWYAPERKIRGWAERHLLSLIGRKSDAVVVVTSGHADDFKRLGIPPRKIKVVPNGFDEEDFRLHGTPATNGLLKPGYLQFTHLGTIYSNCSGKFFEALKELAYECPGLNERIRINVIGYPDKVVERYADDQVLRPLLNMHGFIGHRQSIEVMCASHCLLLFWANRDFAQLAIAGKTYEYLRSGRPVLAITYPGPMKTLIEKGNAGWVIHPDDKHGIKEALVRIITAGSSLPAMHAANGGFAAQFRYDRLAASMARIFDSISSNDLASDHYPY